MNGVAETHPDIAAALETNGDTAVLLEDGWPIAASSMLELYDALLAIDSDLFRTRSRGVGEIESLDVLADLENTRLRGYLPNWTDCEPPYMSDRLNRPNASRSFENRRWTSLLRDAFFFPSNRLSGDERGQLFLRVGTEQVLLHLFAILEFLMAHGTLVSCFRCHTGDRTSALKRK